MARKSGLHFVMLECKYALLAKQVLQVSISSRKKTTVSTIYNKLNL